MTRPIGIVVVTYNSDRDIGACLAPWLSAGVPESSVIVVDNASVDQSIHMAAGLGVRIMANPVNLGFAAAANRGINQLLQESPQPEWILLLNPDTTADSPLDSLLAEIFAVPSNVEMLIPSLLSDNGSAPNVVRYPDLRAVTRWIWDSRALVRPRGDPNCMVYNYVIGSVLLLRAELWKRLDGVDETYFLYGEDADLSSRLSRMRITVAGINTPIRHAGNQPLWLLPRSQQVLMIEAVALFNRRHHGRIQAAATMAALVVGMAARSTRHLLVRDSTRAGTYAFIAVMAFRTLFRRSDQLQKKPTR